MNFNKITIMLKKVQRVVDTLKDADIEVSSIERELILSYVRELESAVREGYAEEATPEIQQQKKKPEPAPPVQAPPSPAEEEPEVKGETPAPVDNETSAGTPTTEEKEEPREPGNPSPELPEELGTIFDIQPGTELSDKLSFSPIKDLRKSMGVNERIFTINELFNGDQQLFDEVIQELNQFGAYGEASAYLMKKVAIPYHWEEKDKKKKAEHFVRLVFRRYL